MGLDSYTKRKLDQTKEEYKIAGEIEEIPLDKDLREELMEAKRRLELEEAVLKNLSKQERMEYEIRNNSKRNMDSLSFSEKNLFKSNQQEESLSSYPNMNNSPIQSNQHRKNSYLNEDYDKESVRQAKEAMEQNFRRGQELLDMLQKEIDEAEGKISKNPNLKEERLTSYPNMNNSFTQSNQQEEYDMKRENINQKPKSGQELLDILDEAIKKEEAKIIEKQIIGNEYDMKRETITSKPKSGQELLDMLQKEIDEAAMREESSMRHR